MFPITTVNFSFSIGEIFSQYTPDAVAVPPRRQAGMYVYIKPFNQNESWFWGVLTREIDAERSVWAYQRLEQIEIIEHIEKELREQEFIAIPELDEFFPGNLLAGTPA